MNQAATLKKVGESKPTTAGIAITPPVVELPMVSRQPKEVFRHTISVLVDNDAGILARVSGMISGRGYNIESLTVAEVDRDRNLSRINITTAGTRQVIEQIKAQLGRLVPVHEVRDLTDEGPSVTRELALVKVVCTGRKRMEALRMSGIFRASVIDSTAKSFVFEVVGDTEKVDAFIEIMRPLGIAEISRTGVAAIARGETCLGSSQQSRD